MEDSVGEHIFSPLEHRPPLAAAVAQSVRAHTKHLQVQGREFDPRIRPVDTGWVGL